jgi:2-polyprenyl-3-methyl-5-hydroxy-6-metoxy-1,4-benzoquinol methylase
MEERNLLSSTKDKELRFEFGKNWAAFLSVLNDDRIANAESSLKRALRIQDLRGKTFIDIGCGSGLFSLAAVRLGAKVHSFDYDPQSVACTSELKRRYYPGDPRWTIERASALDQKYLKQLGQFDVVYSWGVLHHTGDMWQALTNIAPLVKNPDGKLFIAIYNDLGTSTQRWRAIKKLYVSSNIAVRWTLLTILFTTTQTKAMIRRAINRENPLPSRAWREYKSRRGMSVWHDFVDWVGGYPYETAKPEEIFEFYRQQGLSLDFLQTGGLGCNEFVFSCAQAVGRSAA